MNKVLNISGAVLALLGIVWILQGINALPGSFMTNRTEWAVYGTIALASGCIMLLIAQRLKGKQGARYSIQADSRPEI